MRRFPSPPPDLGAVYKATAGEQAQSYSQNLWISMRTSYPLRRFFTLCVVYLLDRRNFAQKLIIIKINYLEKIACQTGENTAPHTGFGGDAVGTCA